jgi:predicted DNA-binding transcriptional regulator YafY
MSYFFGSLSLMPGTAALSRLERLERLQGLLREGESATSGALGLALGVDARTIRRDLQLLRDAGVPIESERGRGGGVRLPVRWSLGRIHLSEEEAVDLLLSLAVAEKMDSPLLLDRLPAVRQKLAAAFSERQQKRIGALRKRIFLGQPASDRVLESYRRPGRETLALVKSAFFEMRLLRIAYVNEAGEPTTREIEPQFLYLNLPVWYLLSWDRLRDGVRFFRIDRLKSVEKLDAAFRLRDPQVFLVAAEHAARTL